MNYRHAYHAGNFADVFKHALLARMLLYLMRKEAALRFIDTHAGIGLYDLAGAEAGRTGEWRDGIARMAALRGHPLLKPWLDAVGAADSEGCPVLYPGSPALAQSLLRPQDRMSLCEMHPDDAQMLALNMGRDKRVRIVAGDGYSGLNALLPPPERRGLVLIDPPFEATDEFARMEAALSKALGKWPTGVYALWYPVKGPQARAFGEKLAAAGIKRLLRLELDVGAGTGLSACGLVVVNPPYALEAEAREILPLLAATLGRGPAAWRVERLAEA